MYKYLAFDLDGTLLNSNKEIDLKTKKLIKKLSNELKKTIILISGRHFNEMKKYIDDLSLQERCYFISSDGYYIYDKNLELIYNFEHIKKSYMKKLFLNPYYKKFLIISEKGDYQIEGSLVKYILKKIRNFIFNYKLNIFFIKSKKIEKIEKIEKIIIHSPKKELINNEFCIHLFKDEKIELLNKNVNKYKALVKLHIMKKIDIDNLLYFGDDINDYECFLNLKNTVSMGNANQNIKNLATYTTEDCDHYGVYNFLYKLEILKRK